MLEKKYFSKFPDVDILIQNYKAYWISTIISESAYKLEKLIEILKEIFRYKDKDENINNNIMPNMANYILL